MRGSGYRQPSNWAAIRRRILERDDYRCYSPYPALCNGEAVSVDHLRSVGQGGSHEDDNLAAICQPCHDAKTEAERRFGFANRRARRRRGRTPEPHPNRPAR